MPASRTAGTLDRKPNEPAPPPDMALVDRDDEFYADTEACQNLLAAMWRQARADIEVGRQSARLWLYTPEFENWARLSATRVDPEAIRAHLLSLFGTGRQQAPEAPGGKKT